MFTLAKLRAAKLIAAECAHPSGRPFTPAWDRDRMLNVERHGVLIGRVAVKAAEVAR
ncbi:MAG: hypothetical protein JST64_00895 [Actinobacteria bacterium]|nr:hypothetical protein [Actinomycetota bacterium]